MTTFNHPKPQAPQVVLEIQAGFRRFDRAMRKPGIDGLVAATEAMIQVMGRKLTPAEAERVAEYNRQVDAYNRAVYAYRAQRATAAQVRQNAAQVAAVRQAACSKCTTTHPGEC